ncbi:MAG: hypothetical protein K6T31_04200, partial [Alicyclobacillus sp.]|nr:hypothetical protein [Alicyclobacillus sp.]
EVLDVPGCGYFKTLNNSLRLTQDPIKAHRRMSTWELPTFYYKSIPWGVKPATWQRLDNNRCTVETTQGQEFVTPMRSGATTWLRNLFLQNQNNLFVAPAT